MEVTPPAITTKTLFMFIVIVTGINASVLIKLLLNCFALSKEFKHIWFVTFICNSLQIFVFPFYYRKMYLERKKTFSKKYELENLTSEKLKPPLIFYHLIILSFLDIISLPVDILAIYLIPVSIYRMLAMCKIFTSKFLSVVFVKNQIYRHQVMGMILVSIGIALVGYISIVYHSAKLTNFDTTIGIVLTVLGQNIIVLMYFYDEYLFRNFYCKPSELVNYEELICSISV